MNGQPVNRANDLANVLDGSKIGDTVTLLVRRGDGSQVRLVSYYVQISLNDTSTTSKSATPSHCLCGAAMAARPASVMLHVCVSSTRRAPIAEF